MKWLSELLDRIFVVLGALLLSQVPLFIQQYQQHLAGHVAELQYQIDAMEEIAGKTGKTLNEFIQKFISSSDLDFSAQGRLMSAMVERFTQLSEALTSLENASILTKPFIFLAHSKYMIVNETWHSFELGLTFTFEGLVYALVGMCLGYFIYLGISKMCLKIYKKTSMTSPLQEKSKKA